MLILGNLIADILLIITDPRIRVEGMIKEVFKQLMKDKFAKAALIVLAIIYLALFFADFLAPYTKDFFGQNHGLRSAFKDFCN